jgi:hypothetical protein
MPSTVVASFNYNPAKHILRIVYVSGKVYDYLNVPAGVYEEMKAAESKGTYLNLRIKGFYRYKKVEC